MNPRDRQKQNYSSRRRGKKYSPFVMLPHYMLDCEAWKALSPQARALYIAVVRRYNGHNNGRIGLSVRDAARECKLSKDTVSRRFRELMEKGFLELKQPGAFSYKLRHAAEWRLTIERDDVALAIPTKTFMRWSKQNSVPIHVTNGPLD